MVRLGTTRAQRKLFFRLNKEKRELERQGFEAAPPLLAERLDVSEADVVDMEQRLAKSDLSVDAPVRDEAGAATYGDFLEAGGTSAEDQVGDDELRRVFLEKVHEFADGLAERERQIVSTSASSPRSPAPSRSWGTSSACRGSGSVSSRRASSPSSATSCARTWWTSSTTRRRRTEGRESPSPWGAAGPRPRARAPRGRREPPASTPDGSRATP